MGGYTVNQSELPGRHFGNPDRSCSAQFAR